MKNYLKELNSHSDNNIFDDIKLDVCTRVKKAMYELSLVLDFALDHNNLSTFDDFLSSTKIEEI